MSTKLTDLRPRAVKVELDKERTLRYTLNSMALIEERFGEVQKAAEMAQNGKITVLRTLLWAGLVHEDKDLTEEEVGGMVDMSNIQTAADAIGEAFGAATPEHEGEGKN